MMLLNDFFKIAGVAGTAVTVEFNPEHVIYKAHFPGHPITPGVCIIQVITEVLEQELGTPLELALVKNLKFISTISPVDDSTVTINLSQVDNSTAGQVKAKGTITAGSKLYTKFSLVYNVQDEAETSLDGKSLQK